MPLTALINTAIGQSNYEIIRDQIAAILAVEFAMQKASFGLPANQCPNEINTERFINIDQTDFPVINVRVVQGTYLDDEGQQTKDSSGTRIGTYKYYLDIYTGSASTVDYFGDEIATKNLQRMAGIVMTILEDTRYATLGFDPRTSGICNTHIEGFFIKESGENENEIDYIKGRIIFVVSVPETVPLPSPWSLNVMSLTISFTDSGATIFSEILQNQIIIQTTGSTLTNAFFSNPIKTLTLYDSLGNPGQVYTINTDFTLAGTTITATTFSFTAGQIYLAST